MTAANAHGVAIEGFGQEQRVTQGSVAWVGSCICNGSSIGTHLRKRNDGCIVVAVTACNAIDRVQRSTHQCAEDGLSDTCTSTPHFPPGYYVYFFWILGASWRHLKFHGMPSSSTSVSHSDDSFPGIDLRRGDFDVLNWTTSYFQAEK